MHAELEKSGENEKRRLERQVKTLSVGPLSNRVFPRILTICCSQDLRDQVVRDTETVRHTLLQKDAEIWELRGRLDNMVRI
jgi:nucleoprotein TPR